MAKTKGYYDSKKKNYLQHKTTMDYLQHFLNSSRVTSCKRDKMIMFSSIICSDCKSDRVDHDGVRRVIDVVRQARESVKQIWNLPKEEFSNEQKAIMAEDVKHEAVDYVADIKFSRATMRKLLLTIEESENVDIGRTIFYTLFATPNASFCSALKESRTHMDVIEQNPSGDMEIYGLNFARISA